LNIRMVCAGNSLWLETIEDDRYTPLKMRRVTVHCSVAPRETILRALRRNFSYCRSGKRWYSSTNKRLTVTVGHLIDVLVRENWQVESYLLATKS